MTTEHDSPAPEALAVDRDMSSFTPDTWTALSSALRDEFLAAYDAVRTFREAFTSAVLSAEDYRELSSDLGRWNDRLGSAAVDEAHQLVGRLPEPAPAFKALLHQPWTEIDATSSESLAGRVFFGRYHLGGGGAAHGGAISLFMDQALGDLARLEGRDEARTATLDIRYISPAPIDETLMWEATIDREEGRKRWCTICIERADGTLCARGAGLLIVPRPEHSARAYWESAQRTSTQGSAPASER